MRPGPRRMTPISACFGCRTSTDRASRWPTPTPESSPSISHLALQQRPLEVYEDGQIVRDFVFIDDVVDALFAVIERPATDPRCLDIGSGVATTIHELACTLAAMCGAPEPIVVGRFRDGDVRAARCDIGRAKGELDWQPRWALKDGLRALLEWIGGQ